MEERKEIFTEVARLMQQKYTRLLEIDKLTMELGEVLSRDDRESAQLLLAMRQNEMDIASETEHGIRAMLDAVDAEGRMELKSLLNGEKKADSEDFEAGKVFELGEKIRNILAHTISIDKVVSRKLAGKDSYYASQK